MPENLPYGLTQDDRFHKLPKWAKEKIEILEQIVKSETAVANHLRGAKIEAVGGRIILDPWDKKIPLGDRDTIRFFLSDAEDERMRQHVDISIRRKTGVLDVNSSDSIGFWPRAANAGEVTVKGHFE